MLTNAQMKRNRFLRLHTGRALIARINAEFDAGNPVAIATYTRTTWFTPKHRDFFRMDSEGNIRVRFGKRWDVANPSVIHFVKAGR